MLVAVRIYADTKSSMGYASVVLLYICGISIEPVLDGSS